MVVRTHSQVSQVTDNSVNGTPTTTHPSGADASGVTEAKQETPAIPTRRYVRLYWERLRTGSLGCAYRFSFIVFSDKKEGNYKSCIQGAKGVDPVYPPYTYSTESEAQKAVKAFVKDLQDYPCTLEELRNRFDAVWRDSKNGNQTCSGCGIVFTMKSVVGGFRVYRTFGDEFGKPLVKSSPIYRSLEEAKGYVERFLEETRRRMKREAAQKEVSTTPCDSFPWIMTRRKTLSCTKPIVFANVSDLELPFVELADNWPDLIETFEAAPDAWISSLFLNHPAATQRIACDPGGRIMVPFVNHDERIVNTAIVLPNSLIAKPMINYRQRLFGSRAMDSFSWYRMLKAAAIRILDRKSSLVIPAKYRCIGCIEGGTNLLYAAITQ